MTWYQKSSKIFVYLSAACMSIYSPKISRGRTSCLVTGTKETDCTAKPFAFFYLTKPSQTGVTVLGCFLTEDSLMLFLAILPLHCYPLADKQHLRKVVFLVISMPGIGTSVLLQREVEVAELVQVSVGRSLTFQACWRDRWGKAVAVVSGSSYLALPTALTCLPTVVISPRRSLM